MPSDVAMLPGHAGRTAFVIKWVASVMQIAGYTATGFDWTPWNAYLFLGGVAGWLVVGVLWNDRALMHDPCGGVGRDVRRVVESMIESGPCLDGPIPPGRRLDPAHRSCPRR